jgi:hypothetical protein
MLMNLEPPVWIWDSVVRYATYPATEIEIDLVDTHLESISIDFSLTKNGESVLSLTSLDGDIAILESSPPTWKLRIEQIDRVELEENEYFYEMKSKDLNDFVMSEAKGKWRIEPALTKFE